MRLNSINAVAGVREGKNSAAGVARKYHKSRTTLINKLKRSVPTERKMGPDSILTIAEEKELVCWIIESSSRGHPITKEVFLENVARLVKKLNGRNPYSAVSAYADFYSNPNNVVTSSLITVF